MLCATACPSASTCADRRVPAEFLARACAGTRYSARRPGCTNPFSGDLTRRSRDEWLIDFTGLSEQEASLFEAPFSRVTALVKPERAKKREPYLLAKYWLHKRSSPEMRKAIEPLVRFIATPMVSKYRLFVWLPTIRIPENAAIVIARSDDAAFGVLHSRFHELWSLKMWVLR